MKELKIKTPVENEIIIPKEEPKQETLEEAAERCFKEMKVLNPKGGIKDFIRLAVNFGTEWQQERMYSEEEVLKLLKKIFRDNEFNGTITEWFEQFKKK